MPVLGSDAGCEGREVEEIVDYRRDCAAAFDGEGAVLSYVLTLVRDSTTRVGRRTGGQKSSCMSTTINAGTNVESFCEVIVIKFCVCLKVCILT